MIAIPKWVENYVGLPFEKYNCWQLICKIYGEQFAIRLPTLEKEYRDHMDRQNIEKLYTRELARIWRKVDDEVLGDCIVLRILSQPWHVGLILAPGLMLHTEKKLNSVVERYNTPIWKNRIIGFYRYDG